MDDIKAKQQVVEKIKEASKILVTVSDNPSVDALSAALGLTLLFDKQEKYATAIFSGETPPAIAFLEPEKTFDDTTDSLRDFIIALNKEKADHLRYKVEGDSVKIFITPYKTTINKEDLEFSQGDYNVELVIALGVDKQEHLDKALENHGQILHDATVITVSAGDQSSDLGGIDWHDASASSLSEMVSGLGEALKEDKKSLVDAQIATALLTGIVAETERFSNQHTTSRAMTVAAQLMSAGADQQLIATELTSGKPAVTSVVETDDEVIENGVADDGSQGNISVKKDELSISHDASDEKKPGETLEDLDKRVRTKNREEAAEEALKEANRELANQDVDEPVEEEAAEPVAKPAKQEEPVLEAVPDTTQPIDVPVSGAVATAYTLDSNDSEPSFGGTLNATSEQAADDARREAMSDQNKTILSHAYLGNQPAETSSPTEATGLGGFPGTPAVAPGSVGINTVNEEVHSAYAGSDDASQTSSSNSAPTFGVGGERVIAPLEPIQVPAAPIDLGLPLPPPIPDFSQGPLAPPVFPTAPAAPFTPEPFVAPTFSPTPQPQPEILGDILAPEPAPAYSVETPPATPVAPVAPAPETPAAPSDPGQFKIPT